MNGEEGNAIELRKYQELIAMQALHANTIAFLPTGLGKTFVALYVLKQKLQSAKVMNPTVEKVAILVAPKKALVSQHVRTMKLALKDLKINELNGESKSKRTGRSIDYWARDDWLSEIQRFDVLAMTSAICRDLMERKYIPDDALECLVLDECHSASGNDEMARLCDIINSSSYKPLILGLTASPIKAKKGHAIKAIIDLEERMNSTFFVPTEEFIKSLEEFKVTAETLVVHYPVNPDSSASTEVMDYWESTIKEFITLASYIQDMKDYDDSFDTSFMTKLVAEVSCGTRTSVALRVDQRLSLWKKIIQQTLQMTRSVGPFAGSLAAKECVSEQLSRRRGALVFAKEEGQTRKHRNDLSVQEDRWSAVVSACTVLPDRLYSLEFLEFACNQPLFIFYLLLEMSTCMMKLLGIDPEPLHAVPPANVTASLWSTAVHWIVENFAIAAEYRRFLWTKFLSDRFAEFIDSDAVVHVAYSIFTFIHRAAHNDMSFKSNRITSKTKCLLHVLCAILSNTSSELGPNFRAEQRKEWTYELQKIVPEAALFQTFRADFRDWEQMIRQAVEGGNNSIIVFCDMKLATTALHEIFVKFWSTIHHIKPPCSFLHGGMSIETQKLILERFKKGSIRVLFASEVAEEGIDIGKCRFVVHFDPPKTVKSQIQRRGRARAAHAQLIHIWPDSTTDEYDELLATFTKFHHDELKMASVMEEFTTITRELARAQYGGLNGVGMREVVTKHGHTIDVISAQSLVIQYCQALYRRRQRRKQRDEDDIEASTTSFQPYYVFRRLAPTVFEAELRLPWDKMTHLGLYGQPAFRRTAQSKRLAQGLTAMDAVRWLLEVREIDDLTLRPTMNPIVSTAGVDLDGEPDEEDEDRECIWRQKTVPDALLPPSDFPAAGLRLYQYRIVVEKRDPTRSATAAADFDDDDSDDDEDEDDDVHGDDGGEDGGVDISDMMRERNVPFPAPPPPQPSTRHKGRQVLSALNDIVILTARDVLTSNDWDGVDGFPLTLPGDEKLRETPLAHQDAAQRLRNIVRYEPLGERFVSYAELLWIARFHTAIVQVDCLLPDLVGSDLCPLVRREADGFFAIDDDRRRDMSVRHQSVDAEQLLTHIWSKSPSIGATYWICPRPCLDDNRALMDAVVEAELLVANCQIIQQRNAQGRPVLDLVVDPPVPPRADLVYTSTGNALFRYKSFVASWTAETGGRSAATSVGRDPPPASFDVSLATSAYEPSTLTRKFTDVMKVNGTREVTYADHYRRSGHSRRQRFLENNRSPGNALATTLFRGHSLSGKLTLHNFLQPPQGPQQKPEPKPLGSAAGGSVHRPPVEIIVPSAASSVSTLTASTNGSTTIAATVAPKPPAPSSWNFFAPAFSVPVGHLKWYRLVLAIPSVLARFQSVVMAKEAQQVVFGPLAAACDQPLPRVDTVLTAITNTRAMENISNERLEFLGDSFLKYAATVYVLLSALLDNLPQFPPDVPLTAESLTDVRQVLLTNKTLSERMDKLGLLHYLRVAPISRGQEQLELALPDSRPRGGPPAGGLRNVNIQATRPSPPAAVLTDGPQFALKTFSEGVPRKVRADFLEALLGAAVVAATTTSTASSPLGHSAGHVREYHLALAWQAFVQLNLMSCTQPGLPSAFSSFVAPKWQQLSELLPPQPSMHEIDASSFVRELGSILGYEWRRPVLARWAVTHPSAVAALNMPANGRFPQHYDVLEFVGDAVLDFVVVLELFRRHPTWDESELTSAKVALVNNNFLGHVATTCGLPSLIRHGDMEVFRETFAQSLQAANNDDADVGDDLSALTEHTRSISLAERQQRSSPRHPTMARPPVSPLPRRHDASNPHTPVSPETFVGAYVAPAPATCTAREMKIRADVFEALVGAVFVDSEGDLAAVQRVLRQMGYWTCVETYS